MLLSFSHRLELGVSEKEDIQNESGIFTVSCYLTVQRYCEIIDGPEVSWDGLNSCSFHKGNWLSLPRSVWTSDWVRGVVFNTSFQYLNTCWINFPGARANQGLAFPISCPAMGWLPRATADTVSATHQVWTGNYFTVRRTQTLRQRGLLRCPRTNPTLICFSQPVLLIISYDREISGFKQLGDAEKDLRLRAHSKV